MNDAALEVLKLHQGRFIDAHEYWHGLNPTGIVPVVGDFHLVESFRACLSHEERKTHLWVGSRPFNLRGLRFEKALVFFGADEKMVSAITNPGANL